MLAVGIDTSGLTHAGSVVAAQALLQLNGALMVDILTAGGDPDPAVARAPLHLGQTLIGGTSFSSCFGAQSHHILMPISQILNVLDETIKGGTIFFDEKTYALQ